MLQILIINSAEPGTFQFTEPLKKVVLEAVFMPVVIEYADTLHTDLDVFCGIIISGSPQGDDIVEHHKPYFNWLKNYEKPVFGICAGHHVTGSLYGAKLLRSEEPESGDFEVQIVENDPLLNNLPRVLRVKQMHNDSITVPDDFKLIATASTCKNQIMKHKKKPLYTCQFHPEFYNHDLILNFIQLCK